MSLWTGLSVSQTSKVIWLYTLWYHTIYRFWQIFLAVSFSSCCVYPKSLCIICCLHSKSAIISVIMVTPINFQTCGRQTALTSIHDYKIWVIIQQRVRSIKVKDVKDLTQHPIHVWAEVEHSIIHWPSAQASPYCFQPQKDIINIHCDKN